MSRHRLLGKPKRIFFKPKEMKNWQRLMRKSKLPKQNRLQLSKLQRKLKLPDRRPYRTRKTLRLISMLRRLKQMRPNSLQLGQRTPPKLQRKMPPTGRKWPRKPN